MTLTACAVGAMLWAGAVNGQGSARCCIGYFSLGTPPPDRPAMLGIQGDCRVKTTPQRRRWRRRHQLYGTDDNGVIHLELCRDYAKGIDCCTLEASGPTGTLVTPKPTSLVGTYVCADGRSGPFELAPTPP